MLEKILNKGKKAIAITLASGLIGLTSYCGGSGGNNDKSCCGIPNNPPVAVAGINQPLDFDENCFDFGNYDINGVCLSGSGYNIKNNIHYNNQVTLDGSGSYDLDDTITYSWRQISGPGVALSDPTAVNPTFTSTTPGDYNCVFGLEVDDGKEISIEDIVTVYIRDNLPPVANTIKNATIDSNTDYGFDFTTNTIGGIGSFPPVSSDVDGTIIQYCVTIPTVMPKTCENTGIFLINLPDPLTDYGMGLEIEDDDGYLSSDSSIISTN